VVFSASEAPPVTQEGTNVRTFFIVAGCVWFGLALLFVLSFVCAARRALPAPPGLTTRRGASDDKQSGGDSEQQAEETGVTPELIDV
jgi:hypothetical protein